MELEARDAWTTSPRAGTRPSVLKIMPPIVSTYSPCSPAVKSSPIILRDLVDLGLAVDDEDAVAGLRDQRLLLVVLVLDVADDHLDDVLQRDQAVGAAIFVDDQRHLRAGRLHARHQVGGQHRGRHEQHGADQVELADRLGEVDIGEVERGRRRRLALAPRPFLTRASRG